MVTGDDLGKLVRYWRDDSGSGWHTGKLVSMAKPAKQWIAVIETPIVGQRKRRVPAENCEPYPENGDRK